MLELRNVSKTFDNDTTIVADCSFTVERGSLTVMVGPSGCGKTSLINMIAGYESPTTGEIILDGKRVTSPDPERLVVFQETALFPWMTVIDNVMFGPLSRGSLRPPEARDRARKLLESVGLREFADRYPSHLSGGMQRRAELARAIINEPKLMLMDEPFRGLDAMTRELMQEQYLKLFDDTRVTNLFVTSEIEEAIFLGDRLLLMTDKPTRVARTIEIDLPRPRTFDMLSTRHYQELWEDAMQTMHAEASAAFAEGSTMMRDRVDAMSATSGRKEDSE